MVDAVDHASDLLDLDRAEHRRPARLSGGPRHPRPRPAASVAPGGRGSTARRGPALMRTAPPGCSRVAPQRAGHAATGGSCIGAGLQRRGAADKRVGGNRSARRQCAGARWRPAEPGVRPRRWWRCPGAPRRRNSPSARRGLLRRASRTRQAEQVAEHPQDLPRRACVPRGLTTPWRICTRPSALTKPPGSR